MIIAASRRPAGNNHNHNQMELQMIQTNDNWQWGELAPYLAGLNVGEALEDFGRLADRVLSQQQLPVDKAAAFFGPQVAPPAASFDEHRYEQHYRSTSSAYSSCSSASSPSSSCLIDESVLSPSSPGNVSEFSSATSAGTCCSAVSSHWSQTASPVFSERSFSCASSSVSSPVSLSSSSSHYYCSSSSSSASSSVAGSICGDPDDEHHRRRLSSRSWQSGGVSKTERKRQNASAAERYRRKQRGRQCNLDEELEHERQRNAQLMKSFEAKLELYREFAKLLADNTRDPNNDVDLAKLGSSSLENIIERICPAEFLAQNVDKRVELERLLEHFKRVLSVAGYATGHQQRHK